MVPRNVLIPFALTLFAGTLLLTGCSESGGSAPVSAASPDASADAVPSRDRSDAAAEETTSKTEQYREQRNAAVTVSEHLALAHWCRNHGLADEASLQWTRALRLDPECEEAREALGHVRYEAPDSILFSADYRGELDVHRGSWQTPEEMRDLRRLETEIRERTAENDARAESDPWFAKARHLVSNRLTNEALSGTATQVVLERPFVILVQGESTETAAAIEALLDRTHDHLKALLGDALPDEAPVHPIGVTVLAGAESCGAYRGSNGESPDVARVASVRSSREITTWVAENDGVPSEADLEAIRSETAIAAAELLLDAYAGNAGWKASMWLRYGIARYVAPPASAKAEFAAGEPHRDLLQSAFDANKAERSFPLFDLVGYLDEGRMMRDVSRRIPESREEEDAASVYLDLAKAQAWLLVATLAGGRSNLDDSKAKLRALAAKELAGEGGRTAFREATGLRLREEYEALERSVTAYLEKTYYDEN